MKYASVSHGLALKFPEETPENGAGSSVAESWDTAAHEQRPGGPPERKWDWVLAVAIILEPSLRQALGGGPMTLSWSAY